MSRNPRSLGNVGLVVLHCLAGAMAACGVVADGTADCSTANGVRPRVAMSTRDPAPPSYIGDEFADVEHALLARPDEDPAPTF